MATPSDDDGAAFSRVARVAVPEPAPPAWTGLTAPGGRRELDALHRMLAEGAQLASHVRSLHSTLAAFRGTSAGFAERCADFITSVGQPAAYEPRLTDAGVAASAAAAAAAPPASRQASSAFAPEARQPTLPLLGAAGITAEGLRVCPGVPCSSALGVAGGLTAPAPAAILLPKQHAALFSTEQQRRLVAAGGLALGAALSERLLPELERWLQVFDACKDLLPQVERLRADAAAARQELQAAQEAVVQAEAEAGRPLVSREALQAQGAVVPRVLVQEAATGGGGLIPAPAMQQRQELYKKDEAETDAALAFELAEAGLRDKLRWLVSAGAGLKALIAAALAHSLRAAAAAGGPGEAAGGTAAGRLRAPPEELLEPFPAHVLAHLRGEHLPTLPQLVAADQDRLARWAERCRAAMAAAAATDAAAAGARMLAAAAGAQPAALAPAGPPQRLDRTDGQGGAQAAAGAGTAGMAPAAAEAVAGMSSGLGQLQQQMAATAREEGLPLDLLAAAVEGQVRGKEAGAAGATLAEIAWRLLHDASVMLGKEQAVLLPAVRKSLGELLADRLADSHRALAGALSRLQACDPAAPDFDVAALEVLLEEHASDMQRDILPGLREAYSDDDLRALARAYRRAAAAAPTRPHAWLMSGGGGEQGAAASWLDAAGRAAKALAKAAAAAADSAADAARWGPLDVPGKA